MKREGLAASEEGRQRRQFAALAMMGIIAGRGNCGMGPVKEQAAFAFDVAEAMLDEEKKRDKKCRLKRC